MKFKDEEDFRRQIVADLQKQEIPIVSLGTGTFDAYVEDVGLVEMKNVDWKLPYRGPTIEFSKPQTQTLKLLMKLHMKMPFVLVFGNDKTERYYLLKPEDVKSKLESRMGYPAMWITEDKIPVKSFGSYEELIEACIKSFKK